MPAMPALLALLATALPIAAVFLALGTAKVLALAPMRARAAHLGLSTSSYRIIGTLEIAGAVGVLLGLAAPTLGAFAAVGLLLLLAGAVLAHLRNGDNPRLVTPALVSGLFVAAYLAVLIGTRP